VTRRGDSALIRSLAETGFNLRVISPEEVAWARGDGPFSVVVYEYSSDSKHHFAEAIATHQSGTVVLALVSRDDHQLRAELLRAGADYCLMQPVSVFEVEAVLHSFFKRQGVRLASSTASLVTSEHESSLPLRLNRRSHQATWRNKVLSLSEREMAFLHTLMRSDGAVMDRQTLWREIWGEDQEFNSQALDLAISRLRRKLTECPVTIINLRGFGYRLSGHFEIE